MKVNKSHNLCVRITSEENKMVEVLRNKHCTNISKFIRKLIRDTYSKMENVDEAKKRT